MCGICGIITKESNRTEWAEIKVKSMADTMVHRGPDADGFHSEGKISFGQRRLAIIDLSEKGRQPMADSEHKIWITFNGEIYNYRELKQKLSDKYEFKSGTDTEMIIYAYKEWGIKCLEMFRGMFAFAIYDKEKEEILIARDHFGQKPLYYCLDRENNFYFASEINAILKTNNEHKEINYHGLHLYFLHNYRNIPDPYTIIEGIYKLPPASYLIYDLKKNNYLIGKYWRPDYSNTDLTEVEYIAEYKKIVGECISLTEISDTPIGILLSGGVDSSTIASYMKDRNLSSFAVGCSQTDPEIIRARKIAKLFNTNHNELIVDKINFSEVEKLIEYLGEPLNLLSAIFSNRICKAARAQGIKVLIGGNGADEIFYGYDGSNRLLLFSRILNLLPLPKAFLNRIKSLFYRYKGRIIKRGIYADIFSSKLKGFDEGQLIKKYSAEADSDLYIDKSYYAGLMSENQHSVTIIGDLTGMMNSMEIRTPFLDPKMFEFASRLPIRFKVYASGKKKLNKYIMRKSMEGILPDEIIWGSKMGFGYNFSLAELIRHEWRLNAYDYIFNYSLKTGLFRQDKIKKMWSEHLAGKKNNSPTLWALVTFGIWYKNIYQKYV